MKRTYQIFEDHFSKHLLPTIQSGQFPLQDYLKVALYDALTLNPETLRGGIKANYLFDKVRTQEPFERYVPLIDSVIDIKGKDESVRKMPVSEYFMSLTMCLSEQIGGPKIIPSMMYGKRDEDREERCGDIKQIPDVSNP